MAVRASFLYSRWTCQVSQPVKRTPLWPASWLPALDEARSSKSVEVQRVWEIYDERLQFMSREDALGLDRALLRGDVSRAWMIWSSAAESALADAFRFAGGPVPARGLVLGRGMVRIRTVRLGVLLFVLFGEMLLMLVRLMMCLFIGTLLLLLSWICGGSSRLF